MGEIRVDPLSNQTTFVMKREIDTEGRRWAMSLDLEPVPRTFGILQQNKSSIKLTTMIDTRVTCVAKNYKVDEKVKELMLTDVNKKSIMEIDAPPLD